MKNKPKKTLKIHPRGNWILIKPDQPEVKNEFELSVPDSVEKEQKARGTILEVGPKVEDLKEGQTVIYGAYAGEPIQLSSKHLQGDKVDYLLLLDEDVLAIIE